MSLTAHHLSELCAPSYLDGLEAAPVAELRARRDDCQRAEVVLSYLRRVLQGEIDLVLAEIEIRRDGGRSDIGRLVDELPTILSSATASLTEPAHSSVHTMPAVAEMMDLQHDVPLEVLLAQVLSHDEGHVAPGELLPGANLCTLGDSELGAVLERLRDEETTLSSKRRVLHERIDAIQATIVDRYKSGAADPDSLLT